MKLALTRRHLWERLSPAGRLAAGSVLRMIPPRFLLGRNFREHTRLVEAAQWWSTERAREHQVGALRRVLRLAYGTPYYRRLFDAHDFAPGELRSIDDLARLPTIDRRTVRDHLLDMCTAAPGDAGIDFVSTGGTGGEPLGFYIDADRSAAEFAHLVASWERVGYKLGTPLAVFRGRVVAPRGAGGLRHEYDPLLRHHYYSAFHMSDDDMARYLVHMRTIGPCFLHAYPSSVAALARFIRRSGFPRPDNVEGIIAESEVVYPEQRAMVEETFGVRYLACYGQTEKVACAAECEATRGLYHVWPTYGCLELLDEEGDPIRTPGRRGEIAGTGFINTVVPFIRYRTGDRATYVADRCEACGRNQVVLADIEGHRTQESLVAADRSRVSITAINMHDDTFDRVRQYRFRQDAPGRAVLQVVPAAGFGVEDEVRILRNLARKLAGRVDLKLESVDAIELTRAGKATYVDQRVPEEECL